MIIENTSGGSLDINDLGVSLENGATIDLTLEANAQDVAASGTSSGDLFGLITLGNVAVKDPIGGANMATADAIEAIRTFNDTHFRMPAGGRIADAQDVDLTGAGQYLRYDGTDFVRQTPADLASAIEGDIDITATTGYSANENIDWTVDQSPSQINAANLPAASNPDLWATITGDTGSALADNSTDTLFLVGAVNGGITTAVNGGTDTVAFAMDIDDLAVGTSLMLTDELAVSQGTEDTTKFTIQDVVDLAASSASDMCGVTVGKTTNTAIPTTWGDVDWDVTHVENSIDCLEHDNTNIDRILIKESGMHLIAFSASFDADAGEETIDMRVRVDDTTVIPGSFRSASEDDEVNDLSNVFAAILTAGTYLTLQTQASGAGNTLTSSTTFTVIRATGVKGDKGDTGAGSNVIIQDEGVTVSGGPHSTLNFTGVPVTVTDAGAGVVDITIDGTGGATDDLPAVQLVRTTGGATIPATWTDIAFDSLEVENAPTVLEHNVATDRVDVFEGGLYEISYNLTVDTGSNANNVEFRVRINDTTVIPASIRRIATDDDNGVANSFVVELADNDFVSLQAQAAGGELLEENSNFSIVKLQGAKGDEGPPGSGSSIITQDEGVVLGTTTDTIDFVGAGVTATHAAGTTTVTIAGGGGGTPGGVDSNIQYNNAGSFGGESNFNYDDTLKRVSIDGIDETTQLTVGGTTDLANASNAALYLEVNDPSGLMNTGIYTYFNRQAAGINGIIEFAYDGNTPNIGIIDEDDDPPYIHFDVIGTGSQSAPQFKSEFGMRGTPGSATTGFSWKTNGVETLSHDTGFLNLVDANSQYQMSGTPLPLKIYEFFADQVDYSNGSDWDVTSGATASIDSNNSALKVRRFDDSNDEAIGFMVFVPEQASEVVIRTKARAETAPAGAVTAAMVLHRRLIPDNAAVGLWTSTALTTIDLPSGSELFQYDESTFTLAALSMTAGTTYQMQLSRDTSADSLVGDLSLLVVDLEFR